MKKESSSDDLEEASLGDFVKYNLKRNGSCKLVKNMHQFFMDELFCDVTLVASDGVKIKAHRIALSIASSYFRVMFCGSFKEVKEDEITFPEIDGRTLKTIITAIYSNSIQLQFENIEYIIHCANFLQVTSIEDVCGEFLASKLDVTTAIRIIQIAEKYYYINLYNLSHKIIVERFMEIRLNEEFFHLEVDIMDKILADDNLRVPSDEEVFNAVSSWIFFAKDRETHMDRLLQRIRMTLVRPSFICDVMENVCTPQKCKELFYKTFKWHCMPEIRLSLLPTEQFRIRSSKDVVIAIDGWQQTKAVLRVGLLYPPLNQWIYREWPCPPEMHKGFASTIFDNKLIIAGGKLRSGIVSNKVDCFDLRTLTWTELPPMRSARYEFKMVVLNEELCAVCTSSNNSVEIYNTITKTWSYTTAMNIHISNPIVGVTGSSLCVSIPRSNGGGSFSLYDHSSLKWTHKWLKTRSLPLGMGTVYVNGEEIFVAICKDEIVHFNQSTGLIERVPRKIIDSEAKGCKVFQNRFIIHGQSVFQEYNPAERSVRTFPRFEGTEYDIIVV